MIIIPPTAFRVPRSPNGKPILTQKFLSGIEHYVRLWPGPVVVVAGNGYHLDSNLDHVEYDPGNSEFRLEIVPPDSVAQAREHFSEAAVVLGHLDAGQAGLVSPCRQRGIPLVFVTEYSLKTRQQIIRAECRNPIRRLVRMNREERWEKIYESAISMAAGVQCNGTPTFESYARLNNRTMMYFDTRVTDDGVIGRDQLQTRTAGLASSKPLRLAFSGRLTAMKGADHLPKVAAKLKSLGVNFYLDIFGGGDQEDQIRREITKHGLEHEVRLHGVVDFAERLIPTLQNSIDLFVCCHVQGDPSCTYLETMSCGVPIVGYANDAFTGVVAHSRVGWVTPIGNPTALASTIARLASDGQALATAAIASRDFAANHTFDRTFRRRIDHLIEIAQSGGMSPSEHIPRTATAAPTAINQKGW